MGFRDDGVSGRLPPWRPPAHALQRQRVRTHGDRVGRRSMTDAAYLLDDLRQAESWHFWFQTRRRLIAWVTTKYCPDAASVLDVGCGTGFIVEALRTRHPRAVVVGCDLQQAPLAMARSRVRN